MLLRQLNIFKVVNRLFADFLAVPLRPAYNIPQTLLIIRLDAIGDYILFRNFLEIIRNSQAYKHYKITLCGNVVWKDITETFDAEYIDSCIWVDRQLFLNNRRYRNAILKDVAERNFEVCLETTTSREIFFGDAIAKASGAINKIGKKGDNNNTIKLWKLLSDRIYTKLIDVSNEVFEFYSNRLFFENVLNEKIQISSTYFIMPTISVQNLIIFFPGASEIKKQWNTEHFAEVAKAVLKNTDYTIIIAGSNRDIELSDSIMSKLNPTNELQRVQSVCGQTSLTELVYLIARASILVSSDTSAMHIGIAVKTKSIGLYDGRHFGRFAPYPGIQPDHTAFFYPPPIGTYKDIQYWINKNKNSNTGYNINEIPASIVINKIFDFLGFSPI
jgi:ADP-heptose:LPS heptosyltransferase